MVVSDSDSSVQDAAVAIGIFARVSKGRALCVVALFAGEARSHPITLTLFHCLTPSFFWNSRW